MKLVPVLFIALLLAGCGATTTTPGDDTVPAPSAPSTTSTTSTSVPAPAALAPASKSTGCVSRTENGQPLPDPACTPGALNTDVTQAKIGTTICQAHWTTSVRPPESYTEKLKRSGIAAYGYADTKLSDYEEDHLVALELGGSPSDPANLWPEPGATPNAKDDVERKLNKAVCSGKIPLATAQRLIATDWTTAVASAGL